MSRLELSPAGGVHCSLCPHPYLFCLTSQRPSCFYQFIHFIQHIFMDCLVSAKHSVHLAFFFFFPQIVKF